jgi:hypothetical protein
MLIYDLAGELWELFGWNIPTSDDRLVPGVDTMSPIQPSVTTELPWACDNIQNPASSLVIQLPLSEETPANTDGEPTVSTMLDQTTIESSSVASPIVTEEATPHDIELSDIFGKSYYLYSIRDFMLTGLA